MTSETRLLVFAKAPLPGAVKTRLIPLLGDAGAAALHARLVEHTLAIAREAALGPLELHGAPATDPFLGRCAARYNAKLIEQCAGDLGTRMHSALEGALAGGTPAILIGSDCPPLTARHLREAAHALTGAADAVVTPTEDGGYALIGVKRCEARLFAGLAWSTPSVMDETRARFNTLNWRWQELETLWDLDRPADYRRLADSGYDFLCETGS